MNIDIVDRLQDVGRAEQILHEMFCDDWFFSNLNRKDPYWETPDFEKLDDCRRRLDCIHDKISRVLDLLRSEKLE